MPPFRNRLIAPLLIAALLPSALQAQAVAGSRTTTPTTTRSGAPTTMETTTPAPPEGMVEDPCLGVVPGLPPVLEAWRRSMFETARTAMTPPPVAELDAYRKRRLAEATRDWANLCQYRADDRRLAAAPQADRQIVFMGDSITENWGAADSAFFTHGVVNRGISGQTTPQMLLRFEADVVALKPRAVHIMAGTNDLAGNTGPTEAQAYFNNIAAMVAIARANRITVILAAIPPTTSFSWRPALHPAAQLASINRRLADYAKREGLIFVDYTPVLAAPDGSFRADLTLDGVHPNLAGYTAMEPLARAALARAGIK